MSLLKRSNRKRRETKRVQLPSVDWARIAGMCTVLAVVAAGYGGLHWMLNRPVDRIVLNGEFERVSADRLEALLRPWMGRGFLEASLGSIHGELKALPWVAEATVRRRWPGTLEVRIREEEPAARWGEHGLLNPQGRLFVREADHIPAELPRLKGPDGSEAEVAARYVAIREQLVQRGLNLAALELDPRGAWSFRLSNGIRVHLGVTDVDTRLSRFYRAFDRVIADMAEQVDHVDMRYSNGFAIGWKQAPASAGRGAAAGSREMGLNV